MSDGERRVVVTGMGILTALGDSVERVHTALCQGRRGLAPVAGLEAAGMPRLDAGRLDAFDARAYLGPGSLRPLDRTARLAASAVKLALDAAGRPPPGEAAEEVGLVVGTTFGSLSTISGLDRKALSAGPNYVNPMAFANTVLNAAAGQTAIRHRLYGVNATVSGGAASGAQALAYATDLIRLGHATAIVAGGAEELSNEALFLFWRAGRLCDAGGGATPEPPLPCHPRRRGFALSEAAAFLVLEDAATAARRGAAALAEIRGQGGGLDRSAGREPREGARAVACSLRGALAEAGLRPDEIDALSLSANGSPELDAVEVQGVREVFGHRAARLGVTAVKSMLGEALGASGALQAALLVASMRGGTLPGIRGLDRLEAGFPLRQAGPECRRATMSRGLVDAVDMNGKVCSLLIEVDGGRSDPQRRPSSESGGGTN